MPLGTECAVPSGTEKFVYSICYRYFVPTGQEILLPSLPHESPSVVAKKRWSFDCKAKKSCGSAKLTFSNLLRIYEALLIPTICFNRYAPPKAAEINLFATALHKKSSQQITCPVRDKILVKYKYGYIHRAVRYGMFCT